jgi:lipopolysaccharide biosynthesis glycosyltransferase
MTNKPLSIFLGYDRRIPIASQVAAHSIIRRASKPVSITFLNLTNLGGLYTREINPLQSTEFSFSRFLVPYLCDYEGHALFMDNDMILQADIVELFNLADPNKAVQVVKHDYQPKEETKFMGAVQTKYEKKNWSSVMLFNNSLCTALTPEYVNTATGLELHQFKWLESEKLIGELPKEWNYLVGYDDYTEPTPKLIHYTEGAPFYEKYRQTQFADQFGEEYLQSIRFQNEA